MRRGRKDFLKAHRQNVRDNGYWDYILYNQLRHGIDYETDFESVLNSVTAENIQRVAQDMLKQKRRIEVTMISE